MITFFQCQLDSDIISSLIAANNHRSNMNLLSKGRLTPDHLLHVLIPALFFFTPISSTAKSILLPIVLFIILSSKKHRRDLTILITNKFCFFIGLLFFIVLLGCLWSSASLKEQVYVLEKWSKLLYLPILIAGFQDAKARNWSIHAFLGSMLLTCILSIFLAHTPDAEQGIILADSIFRNHIMTSIMMSFAAYLAAVLLIQRCRLSTDDRVARLNQGHYIKASYVLLILLFTYQILFINQSRSGYVSYTLLVSLFVLQMIHKRYIMASFLIIIPMFFGCYYLSQTMQHTIKAAAENVRSFHQNKNTSLGYRIQFHDYAKHLFKLHPVLGGGTGSFTHAFKIDNPVPAWTTDSQHSGRLLEPHSQYWFIAAELGALGCMAFLFCYVEMLMISSRLSVYRPMAFALLMMLAIGNLSDSLLFYSGTGYFFILFLALCFSEQKELLWSRPDINPVSVLDKIFSKIKLSLTLCFKPFI